MTAYLSIISGAIKLFNAIAQRLQQHHDEMNGVNAQQLKDSTDELEAIRKGNAAASDHDALKRVQDEYQIDRPA